MNAVSSVALSSARSPQFLLGILLALVGGGTLLSGLGALFNGAIGGGFIIMLIGAGMIALLVIARRWFFGRIYWVSLSTAGGQVRGFRSKDQEKIRRIVRAVNEEIIARG